MADSTLSNCRRILLMVRELHKLGFERLRIAPSMSNSGMYWRCIVTPRFNTGRQNGARVGPHNESMALYSSGQEDEPFGWTDGKTDTPKQLAGKLIVRFPATVQLSHGDDPAYVAWYARMLQATEPNGIVTAQEDFPWLSFGVGLVKDAEEVQKKISCTIRTLGVEADVPLPPPGELFLEDAMDCYESGEGDADAADEQGRGRVSMAAIHLIEKDGRIRKVPDTTDEWESGYWAVAKATAQRLIGGRIYFHEQQGDQSHFGGLILGFAVEEAGEFEGRIVFRFRYLPECRDVGAGRGGWGNEKKIVLP